MTSKFLISLPSLFSRNVLPVTVILSGCNVPSFFINSLIIAGTPPASCTSCIEYDELGAIFDKYGVRLAIALMRSKS
ncbi:Uncharacterised protein [Staphylococcus aureus]|nr:Uncharacterised protein [Staphylococcus aureus]SCU52161.1 Uncharacterised protein [Staphylococcus aureus]